MRIAIANSSNNVIGGAERYLRLVAPALRDSACDVVLLCEECVPDALDFIQVPEDGELFSVSKLGSVSALSALRNWKPDLIYAHGLSDPALEKSLLDIAPVVFFAHNYHGTCISGHKSLRFPDHTSCTRTFGWECIGIFYPRRCGGLNPVTMIDDYNKQVSRLTNLRKCEAIITASEHMRMEYCSHGFAPSAVHTVRLPVSAPAATNDFLDTSSRLLRFENKSWLHLLFVGRMVLVKGGQVLLEALPHVAKALGRKVILEMVGDGPAKCAWEQLAAKITSRNCAIRVNFSGWLARDGLDAAFDRADLLAVPSLWPEPFGLVGPEAGLRGLPAAAFSVGGIPEWLSDGTNGHLAAADRNRTEGLADAIIKCLWDPKHYGSLCEGAIDSAKEFSMERHITHLFSIFNDIIDRNVGLFQRIKIQQTNSKSDSSRNLALP